jgi:hypothetical protein
MKKIIEWFKNSHRWLHLLVGLLIGFGAMNIYCAAYAGIGVAVTSELKDKMWGGLWDWIDFGLTITGVAIGYTIHALAFGFSWI